MASGTNFSLTDKRKRKALDMFKSQHTLKSVATEFGIKYETLQTHLVKHGIDYKAIRSSSLQSMRSMLFESVYGIKDESKRVSAGLQFLNQYPIIEDEVVLDDKPTDSEILLKIRKELDGVK